MHYADRDTKKNRLWAALITLLYALLWGLLVLLVTFRIHVPREAGEGILIDFGNAETGFGADDLSASDEPASEQDPAERMTQQIEEAPAVVPTPSEEPVAEQPRQVNQQALFPGRTADSNSASEGTAEGPGNQGDPAGDPAGAHEGTGVGREGNSVDLSGRSLVGALPKPNYPGQEEGKVMIEIRVNQQGKVESASFSSRGSSTTNRALVEAAQQAALKARFDIKEDAAVTQTGTITYIFRLE